MNGEISTPPPAGDIVNTESEPENSPGLRELRDIAEVPAVEVITFSAVHLMSAAAVKCGLAEDAEAALLRMSAAPSRGGLAEDAEADLNESRKLITALAALASDSAP